ncbi:MAG: NirD/YgiW/YdeI family stress tolerance protein [Alphaproteobacteria bacterium]|nr:NirD/YgiW/YdeI family stress tolerance protein [Alphaproteobacteria bacterium]
MNKTLSALTIALMMGVSAVAMAGDHGKKMMGGFKQDLSQMPVSTVQNAQGMAEDTMVVLQGNISKRIKKNKYLFNDNTGEIIVEIEGYAWNGQDVAPTDMITIVGEIDKDDNVNIVEVDQVMMTPQNNNAKMAK